MDETDARREMMWKKVEANGALIAKLAREHNYEKDGATLTLQRRKTIEGIANLIAEQVRI